MATPNLIQQGVLVQDKQFYSPNTHLHSANLFAAGIRGTVEMDNIGLVKTWTQIFRNVQPLYNFDQIAKTTMYVDSDKGFTWSTAVAMENPLVVEDLSESDKPGIDGQEFKVAFNKPFTVTQVITYDHIHNKFQLIVTQEPYKDGDRWIHHLRILGVSAKNAYLSKEFLTPGTQYYKITSHRGDEFDTVAGSFQTEVGERQWHYYLGNSEIAKDFKISKKALLQLLNGKSKDLGNDFRVWELYKFAPGSDAYKYMLGEPSTNISKIINDVYKGDKKAAQGDLVGKNWFMEIERATMDSLLYEYTMNLMWGTGGRTSVQYDTINVSPGLYWQHRNYGTVVKYNLSSMSLDFLRARIEEHFKFRMDFYAEGEIKFKVGAGLYEFLQKEIRKEFGASGAVIQVGESNRFLAGDRQNLDFTLRFKSFFLKAFPKIKIVMEHEPALDPVFANNVSNPKIDTHHRLSSFTGIIYDLNDIEADNIKLVKWQGDDKLRYQKQVGNIDWMDQNSTFISSGDFSGVKGTMSMRHAGMWLVDPTKSLMFELNNPYGSGLV